MSYSDTLDGTTSANARDSLSMPDSDCLFLGYARSLLSSSVRAETPRSTQSENNGRTFSNGKISCTSRVLAQRGQTDARDEVKRGRIVDSTTDADSTNAYASLQSANLRHSIRHVPSMYFLVPALNPTLIHLNTIDEQARRN